MNTVVLPVVLHVFETWYLIMREGLMLEVRLEFLMAVKIILFWVLMPCELVSGYQDFGERYCFRLKF